MRKIDTIKLFLFIKLDIRLLKKSKINWKTYKKNNEIIKVCKYKDVVLPYNINKYGLTLQTSVTKLLYNDNSKNFKSSDLEKLFSELDFIIRITTKHKIVSVKKWTLTRLDLANNYYCNNENDKIIYLKILNRLSFCHCKNDNIRHYDSSVHAHNKSITYNIYSKSDENISCDNRILRIEFQLKNRTLNRLKNYKTIKSKIFEEVMDDISTLNNIYLSKLYKLGLNKKFSTKNELKSLINKLYKKNIISKRIYENMFSYFIEDSINISTSTLNNYKKILESHDCNHILLDTRPSKKINFLNYHLFDIDHVENNVNFTMLIAILVLAKNLTFNFAAYNISIYEYTIITITINFYDDS